MKSADEARTDLLTVLPHIRYALEIAAKGGKSKLAIISVHADGGGKIECKFDADIIDDIALVIGGPLKLTDEERTSCAARKLVDGLGLTK